MEQKWLRVEGHPDLRKDPESGAVINISSDSTSKERKKLLRQKAQEMESRMERLEQAVYEMHGMLKNISK
jgi:guanylate kinase